MGWVAVWVELGGGVFTKQKSSNRIEFSQLVSECEHSSCSFIFSHMPLITLGFKLHIEFVSLGLMGTEPLTGGGSFASNF